MATVCRFASRGRIAGAVWALLSVTSPSDAQTIWTSGAFVDAAYLFAPNDPANGIFRSRGTAWHVNDFVVNIAAVYVKRPPTDASRWGGELTIHSGKDDEIFGFSATAPAIGGHRWLRHFGPSTASYLAGIGKGLAIQGGIFSSLIGYDSLYAKDNFNYTRPWGADFTPYLMLGVNASYPFTDTLTGTAFVVNGYWHLAHANAVPSSGAQVAYAPTPRLTIKETVMAGPHQPDTSFGRWRFISDTIVERRHERFIIALNFHVATERVAQAEPMRAWWIAAQLPMQWQAGGPWRVAVRPEVAWDSSGRWTLAEQTVTALTSTIEYRRSHQPLGMSIRMEHRVDRSTGPQGGFFADRETAAGVPALTPIQHLLILGAVFRVDRAR